MGNTYLVHHGIKGQKWGKRNGPPYPLDYEDHSSAEKASLQKNKSNSSGNLLSASEKYVSEKSNATVSELIDESLLIEEYMKEFNKKVKESKYKSVSELPRTKISEDANIAYTKVNPKYPKSGTTENCILCTTSSILRMKGYDVKASLSEHEMPNDIVRDCFKGARRKDFGYEKENNQRIISTLEKFPKGSYGNLLIQWKIGGGHSVLWSNESDGLHIYDSQDGTEYTGKSAQVFISYANASESEYYRLDNCEPTRKVLGCIK